MKLKNFIFFVLILPGILIAQNQQSETVELPDFVIRGSESVKLPVMKKRRPELISALSREFFLPVNFANNLSLVNFNFTDLLFNSSTEPVRKKLGILTLRSGYFVLPEGNLQVGLSSLHSQFYFKLWGLNVRDYVKYANYNASGLKGNVTFFVSKSSRILPALKSGLNVEASRKSFYLYGSSSPSSRREAKTLKLNFFSDYSHGKSINFNFNFNDRVLFLNNSSIKEFKPSAQSEVLVYLGGFNLKNNFNFVANRIYSQSFGPVTEYFFENHFTIGLQPFTSFNVRFGFYFAKQDSNILIAPTVNLYYNVLNGLDFKLVYSASSRFLPFADLFDQNRFVSFNDLNGKFIGYNSGLKLVLSYEYQKEVKINGGFEFKSADFFPYFQDTKSRGLFEVLTTNNVKKAKLFLNLFLHNQVYGNFAAKFVVNDVRNANDNFIPYYPRLYFAADYSNRLSKKLELYFKIKALSNYFTDLKNTKKINNYLNISLGGNYDYSNNIKFKFELRNILNRKNYFYSGYREEPLDLLLGVEYNF